MRKRSEMEEKVVSHIVFLIFANIRLQKLFEFETE